MPKDRNFENLPLFVDDATNITTISNNEKNAFNTLKDMSAGSNNDNFEGYLAIIKNHLDYIADDSFKWENVVAFLILQLKNTDCLNKSNEKSHATQIQITSERQPIQGQSKTDDFFPTFTLNKTFKSWRIKIQARMNIGNISQLEGKASEFAGWKATNIQIRRRILNEESNQGNPTLQLCYEDDLLDLRKLLGVNDYLVITKQKNNMVYDAFGLKHNVPLGNGKRLYVANSTDNDKTVFEIPINTDEIEFLKGAENLIVYGAPGVGKSYYLEDNKKNENITRTIFHPDYTYYDFIGSYKPVPLYKINNSCDSSSIANSVIVTADGEKYVHGEPLIDYQFVPGPFTKVLVEAFSKPDEMHTLIIEELNRANAQAVFGDIFQLLDRNVYGKSEYTINPDPELEKYLRRKNINVSRLFIPSNLNIFATMNSADQGVFVMDTAFKRRWNFMYLPVKFDTSVKHANEQVEYAGTKISWEKFVTTINDYLGNECKVNEDKFIGPYFLKEGEPSNKERIASKLLIYLWDDVVRFQRDKLFIKDIVTFSDLIQRYKDGKKIFKFDINSTEKDSEDDNVNELNNPYDYLLGRLVSEDLFNNDGDVVIKAGEIINNEMICDAINDNLLNELEKISKKL